jgi:DedD protein
MAFFKFRKGGDDHSATAKAPDTVEAMRKRAKHRLIGASILVLLAVIGFPILFDSQPRPVPIDVAIEIPDKNTVAPLVLKPVKPTLPQATGLIDEEAPVSDKPSTATTTAAELPVPATVVAPVSPVTLPAVKPVAVTPTPVVTPPKKETKPASESKGRFVVQIGAFADVPKAREARMKLEKAGFKTYTQVIETKDGRRVRVRVGPFETKADATKAADKIKKLDLQTGILEL